MQPPRKTSKYRGNSGHALEKWQIACEHDGRAKFERETARTWPPPCIYTHPSLTRAQLSLTFVRYNRLAKSRVREAFTFGREVRKWGWKAGWSFISSNNVEGVSELALIYWREEIYSLVYRVNRERGDECATLERTLHFFNVSVDLCENRILLGKNRILFLWGIRMCQYLSFFFKREVLVRIIVVNLLDDTYYDVFVIITFKENLLNLWKYY